MTISWHKSQDEALDSTGVKIMVYAPPGYGKTVLNATLPGPTLVISAEKGLRSLAKKNLIRIFGENNASINYDLQIAEIQNFQDLIDVKNYLCSESSAQFKSVALDTCSEIAQVCLRDTMPLFKDGRQAYGEVAAKMSDVFREFRDIPHKHVYFSAHMEKNQELATNLQKFSPEMPGKNFSNWLPRVFDEIYALRLAVDQAGATFRYLQTQPDIQYDCKSRGGALQAMEYPHLGAIIAKLIADRG